MARISLVCLSVISAILPVFGQGQMGSNTLGGPFWPALSGCSMAHCDPAMSDDVGLMPPIGPSVHLRAHDSLAPGSGLGLGCSSNGTTAVCSYKSPSGDAVIAYSADGTRLWTSRGILSYTAYTSVPMIDQQGTVIAADSKRLIRFSAVGKVLWSVFTPGGYPISPIQTSSGAIVIATANGPLSVYDPEAGVFIGSLYLWDDGPGTGFYETVNTPCATGNRVYVSTQLAGDVQRKGRLYAVDVDMTNTVQPLTVAWWWDFGGPSGASPTCVGNTIFFDAYSPLPGGPKSPTLVGLADNGLSPSVLWLQPVPNSVPASVARDPRGGIWVISSGYASIERRSESTGLVIDSFRISDLIADGSKYFPSSATTISGTPTNPVLTFGAVQSPGPNSYVMSVDLTTFGLLWKQPLSLGIFSDKTAGQFPIVIDSAGQPVVVFAGYCSGAYFISQ